MASSRRRQLPARFFVADGRRCGHRLALSFVRVLRPVRGRCIAARSLRLRQRHLRRQHERRTLAIFDSVVAVGRAEAEHELVDDLLLECHFGGAVIFLQSCAKAAEDSTRLLKAAVRTRARENFIVRPLVVWNKASAWAGRNRDSQIELSRRFTALFWHCRPRAESYRRAATPATIATSARLNTYQL